MELTELCKELNNWFDVERHFGTFTIENKRLKNGEELGLQENQYYRVVGSIFNDGVYKYPSQSFIQDEVFEGAVWAMAVPPEVIALMAKINDYETKYGDVVNSPYSSESFGGYSYTKSSGTSSGSAENGSGGVLGIFSKELNRYRKI